MDQITSTQNPRIKQLTNLQQKSGERRKSGNFTIEGQREVQRCLEAGYDITTLYICPEVMMQSAALGQTEWAHALREQQDACAFCQEKCPQAEIVTVGRTVYEKIAYRGGTEGVVAVARTRPNTLQELEERTDGLRTRGKEPLIIVLEGV